MTTVVAEIEERARALPATPSYPAAEVECIRAAAAALDPLDVGPGDVAGAVALLEQRANADLTVAVGSRRSVRGLARWAVVRANEWHARRLAQHVSDLGAATVRLGTAVGERVDDLEATAARQRAELDELRTRLERLEGAGGTGAAGAR